MADISDDDIPLPPAGPLFFPDRNCPRCHGRGAVREDGRLSECTCLLRQRAAHYLGPVYGSKIPWNPDFRPEPYVDQNVRIHNPGFSVDEFQRHAYAAVKSFLLTTGMRFSHRMVTPYDVYQALFKFDRVSDLTNATDLLILLMTGDDHNKGKDAYSLDLPWVIRKRQSCGRVTWLLLGLDYSHQRFTASYGPSLAVPLKECVQDFVELRLGRNPAA